MPELRAIHADEWLGEQAGFLKLFGFGLEGVDYGADTDTAVKVPSIG